MFIKNGLVYTMVGMAPEEMNIEVENGKIKGLGKNLKITPGAEVIDATGKISFSGIY